MSKVIDIKRWKAKRKTVKLPSITNKEKTTTKDSSEKIDVLDITFPDIPLSKKSCGTCLHYRSKPYNVCLHLPGNDFFHLTTKVCTPYNRQFWHPVKYNPIKISKGYFTKHNLLLTLLIITCASYIGVSLYGLVKMVWTH